MLPSRFSQTKSSRWDLPGGVGGNINKNAPPRGGRLSAWAQPVDAGLRGAADGAVFCPMCDSGDCELLGRLLGGVFERSKFRAVLRSNPDIPPLRMLCCFVWKFSVSKVHGGCLPGTSPCK